MSKENNSDVAILLTKKLRSKSRGVTVLKLRLKSHYKDLQIWICHAIRLKVLKYSYIRKYVDQPSIPHGDKVLQVSRKCTFSGFLHWIIRNKVKHPGLPVLVSFILYHHHQIGAVFISHLLYLNRQMLKFMLKNLILALNSENVFLQTWRFLYRCVINLCPYKDSKMLKK